MQNGDLENIMRRCQGGDAIAFDELYAALSARLYGFLLKSCRNRATADDLLQETFVRIHRARATYRTGAPVLPWVFAIARHLAISRARSETRRGRREEVREDLGDLADPAASETAPEEDPRMDAIRAALEALPPGQREVVTMLKVSGMSLVEVAAATGSTVGAVKLKAHRAYEKIRAALGKQGVS